MGIEYGKDMVSYIHLTLVPYIKAANEIKTKPTQHSVKELRSIGIQPDVLVCRSEKKIGDNDKKKGGMDKYDQIEILIINKHRKKWNYS